MNQKVILFRIFRLSYHPLFGGAPVIIYNKKNEKEVMIDLSQYFKKISTEFTLWRRLKSVFIKLEFDGFLPRIKLNNQYKNLINFTMRILTLLGFVFIFISLGYWGGVFIGIMMFSIEQFLERIIFTYTTLFVHPIPNYDGDNWLGVGFFFGGGYYEVNLIFNEPNNAKEVFDCISSWNYNEPMDVENNIKLSFILENDGITYTTYIYPNPDRIISKKAFEDMKNAQATEGNLDEPINLSLMAIICKQFNLIGSTFEKFMCQYEEGSDFYLGAWYIDSGQPKTIPDTISILKKDITIKNRNELNKTDIEYQHGKYTMKL